MEEAVQMHAIGSVSDCVEEWWERRELMEEHQG